VLDGRWLKERYIQLCKALIDLLRGRTEQDVASRNRIEAVQRAVRSGSLDVHALSVDVIAGDPAGVVQRAANLELDAELVATLLRWTLLPLMEQLAKHGLSLRKNVYWERGYCPTCGSWPLLGERRGIEQILFFRCGLCASDWQSEHVFCPFCSSRSHVDIAYLYDDSQEATQRAVTCERCHCYYKSVTTLVPLSTPQLFVTDLATLHLDLIAMERSFGPPA
jgi:FdhE protein